MSTIVKEPPAPTGPRPMSPPQAGAPRPAPQAGAPAPDLTRAVIGGGVAAAVCAGAWAAISLMTGYQNALMALGVGIVVGIAVRMTGGGGQEPVFGYVGAGLSFVGCLLGNLAAGIALGYDGGTMVGEMFDPISLLFYGLAMYEGYKLARMQKTAA